MIDQCLLFETLSYLGIDFMTGVPDSFLNDFCLYAESSLKKEKHIVAANEGNAIAIAAGYHVATGKIPLVYMQNSGIGNAMNPLLSLTHQTVYSIPMILLIGWRGDPATSDWEQHKRQGELTPVLLEDMNILYHIIENDAEVVSHFVWAKETAMLTNAPVALIAKKGIFAKPEKNSNYQEDNIQMNREEAMNIILDYFPKDTIYVATTGRATRELHELKSIKDFPSDNDFLNVGAMGHTSSIALGMALGSPNRRIVCFDGDSAAIMHLGAFTTAGKVKPNNFWHIILNNGVHESVGGQQSAGQISNMTAIAKGSGYNTVNNHVTTKQELICAISNLSKLEGPSFLDIHIRQGIRKGIPSLKISHINYKKALMENLTKEQEKRDEE